MYMERNNEDHACILNDLCTLFFMSAKVITYTVLYMYADGGEPGIHMYIHYINHAPCSVMNLLL